MKLKNIMTDEVVDFIGICVENGKYELTARKENEKGFSTWFYDSLTKLWQDWDDYDEPPIVWYINSSGVVCCATKENYWGDSKEIGNYFGSKIEAEKALEKLKALKRLKDNGFEFTGWKRDKHFPGDFTIQAQDQTTCDDYDLNLLFGSEK